jgi:hypothetical protein
MKRKLKSKMAYCQLVAAVRRFKGAPPLPRATPPISIRIGGPFAPWREIGPVFTDHVGETLPRDHQGAGGLHYRDPGGGDDLVSFQVARDSQAIYFHARTREPLRPSDGSRPWLLLDADGDPATGWEGYEWIVDRTADADGTPWLEKNEGGWSWRKVARVECPAAGDELHLAIPRAALGLPAGTTRVSLDFKWADGIRRPGDPLDFYSSGDVAPEGRFRYRYVAE